LLSKEAGRALPSLLARRHEADYRLLVDVDESAWLAAPADGATFLAAIQEQLARAWPTLALRIET
jgi:hypothetical protein